MKFLTESLKHNCKLPTLARSFILTIVFEVKLIMEEQNVGEIWQRM